MRTAALVIIVVICSRVSVALATITTPIIEHVGSSNPVAEGWTVDPATPDVQFGGTEITGSGSHDFWSITHIQGEIPPATVSYALSSQQLGSDWRLQARVRVIDSPPFSGSDVPFTVIGVRDGTQWAFAVGNDLVGLQSNATFPSLGASSTRDTRSDYHLYEIQFHQNGPGLTDDTADFYYDGELLFADITRFQLYTVPGSNAIWGPDYAGSSSANYEYVAFVPEPVSLIIFAAAFCCLYRRAAQPER